MSSTAPAGRSGLRLGRVLGVPVFVQPSWFLFAAFLVVSYGPALSDRFGARSAYAAAAAFAVLLGLSVLLHEIGHCVVARLFGLPVRSITITLLAGLTEITEPPQTPAREYAVAVAGPLVSLLLCGIGYGTLPLLQQDTLPHLIFGAVAVTNGIVAAFNLLPGLPLDGGRVLRAVVWKLGRDDRRATVVSAWAGRVTAVVVVPLVLLVLLPRLRGVQTDVGSILFTALIAAFVYTGATAALRRAQVQGRLPGVTVVALARPAVTMTADVPLAEAVRRAQAAGAQGIVLLDGADRLDAVVSEAAVVATPEARRPWVSVGTLGRRLEPGMLLDAGLAGEALLDAMRAAPAPEYVVTGPEPGQVRVLTARDVGAAVSGEQAH